MGITEPVLSGKILLFKGSGNRRIRPSSACIKRNLPAKEKRILSFAVLL